MRVLIAEGASGPDGDTCVVRYEIGACPKSTSHIYKKEVINANLLIFYRKNSNNTELILKIIKTVLGPETARLAASRGPQRRPQPLPPS